MNGLNMLKHLIVITAVNLLREMSLPPLTGTDGWQRGRYAGRGGKKRFFDEIGGGCHCDCTRPGDAHNAEAEDAVLAAFLTWMTAVQTMGRRHCECTCCGKWFSGPLLPGEERRIFGCVELALPDDRFCVDCGLYQVRWPSGRRTRLAG